MRIPSAFEHPNDEFNGLGRKPVVLDILAPDRQTSMLPDGLKFVFHINPNDLSINYAKDVSRIQTMGGFVEQVWGDAAQEISMSMNSGAFIRPFTGVSSITNPDYGGTRRQTIAYDKYLDLLALFHNNGMIYGLNGQVIQSGIISLYFDNAFYYGWFSSFTVNESAEAPFKFDLQATFTVDKEEHLTFLPYQELTSRIF